MFCRIQLLVFVTGLLAFTPAIYAQQDNQVEIRAFVEELSKDSTSYSALYGLSRAYAFGGQLENAILTYSKLFQYYPEDADGLLGRGRVYGWQGEYEKALNDLKKVTSNHPDYMDAWYALGDVCMWSMDNEGAKKAYDRCISLDPENPDLYLSRAKIYMLTRQFDRARSDIARAQKLGSDPVIISQRLRKLDRQPVGVPMEYSLNVDQQTFDSDRTDWTSFNFSAKRELSKGSVSLQIFQAKRFDLTDEAFIVDSYFDAWSRAYGNARIQITNDAEILPEYDVSAEIFQGVGLGWELSGGYRLMNFSSERVNIFVVSASKYLGKWNIKARSSIVPKDGKTADSHILTIKRFFNTVDNFLEIALGREKEFVNFAWLNDVVVIQSDVMSVRYQKFFSSSIGFNFTANLKDDELAGAQRGGSLTLLFRK